MNDLPAFYWRRGGSIGDFVASAVSHQWFYINYLNFGHNLRAVLLCKIEVILRQRVLRVMATSHHASAAMLASRTCGSLAIEVGIGDRHTRFAEICTHVRCAKSVTHSAFLRDLLQHMVCLPQPGIA